MLTPSVSELIKRVYAAGDRSEAWDAVVVDLLQLMDCQAGVAALVELSRMQLWSCRVYGPENEKRAGHDEYPDRYQDDPSLSWASSNPDARFGDSRQLIAEESYRLHPFVNWCTSKFGATHWYFGFSSPEEEPAFFLSAYFSAGSDEKIATSHQLFRTVFDHIECALRLGRQPSIDASARALVRIDADGNIEHLSAGAKVMLSQSAPVHILRGRLTAQHAGEQQQLERAIQRARLVASASAGPTAVHLSNDAGRPWVLVVSSADPELWALRQN
jgi:hypothetical protein